MNLLKWKLHLLWRSLTATEAKRVGTVMVALLLLVWIILAFAGIRSFFAFLVGWEENLEAPLAEGVLAVLYLVGLAVSLFTACGSAFVVMYSSSDLELLFAAPLPVGQVFTVKFFEILASVVTPMFFLTIPLMLGYGAAVGAGWQYYPAVLLLALFSLLWPTALGSRPQPPGHADCASLPGAGSRGRPGLPAGWPHLCRHPVRQPQCKTFRCRADSPDAGQDKPGPGRSVTNLVVGPGNPGRRPGRLAGVFSPGPPLWPDRPWSSSASPFSWCRRPSMGGGPAAVR